MSFGEPGTVITDFRVRINIALSTNDSSVLRANGMAKQTRFGKLRKVSGQLRRILTGSSESRNEEQMPRMLIVDDEESICFSMSEYFGLHGYKVDTARELEEAERLLAGRNYEVAILDLRLGVAHNADGLEIIT